MPLYQSLGIGTGTEKIAIVLDIGQAYTKVGFAGEPAPRAIIPTILKDESDEPVISFASEQEIDKKLLSWKLKKFFHHIYFKFLQINPKDRRVILTESLLCPTILRETIAEVLFTCFDVPSVLFVPHHLLACFTVAVNTALVLDCSESESSALPIIEGTPVIWAWHSGPLGSNAIHEKIQSMILEEGLIQLENAVPSKLSVDEDLPLKVIEDIKVKSCFIAEYERAKLIQQHKLAKWRADKEAGDTPIDTYPERPAPPPDMVYPMGGTALLRIPGAVREEAAEVLFEQDNERLSVATLVLDSLIKCPIDSRKELARNLLITGGTAMLPGFLHRLLSELRDLVAKEERYQMLSECLFRVHKPPTHPNLVSWLGAAIYACLEIFQQKSITKEYFTQHGKRLPDWCVLDLKPPEQIIERPNILKGLPSLSSKSRSSAGNLATASARTSTAAAALASLRLTRSEPKLKEKSEKK